MGGTTPHLHQVWTLAPWALTGPGPHRVCSRGHPKAWLSPCWGLTSRANYAGSGTWVDGEKPSSCPGFLAGSCQPLPALRMGPEPWALQNFPAPAHPEPPCKGEFKACVPGALGACWRALLSLTQQQRGLPVLLPACQGLGKLAGSQPPPLPFSQKGHFQGFNLRSGLQGDMGLAPGRCMAPSPGQALGTPTPTRRRLCGP